MTLVAGDIAIVSYNSDNTDSLAFVALVDIPAGEHIKFTDNLWLVSNAFRTGEGIIAWTAPAGGVTKGTVVTLTTTPSADGWHGRRDPRSQFLRQWRSDPGLSGCRYRSYVHLCIEQ